MKQLKNRAEFEKCPGCKGGLKILERLLRGTCWERSGNACAYGLSLGVEKRWGTGKRLVLGGNWVNRGMKDWPCSGGLEEKKGVVQKAVRIKSKNREGTFSET